MTQLPIRQLTLWKQGFGYFERRGQTDAQEITLIVPRSATNDVLKSLNVVMHAGGQVLSVDYETPEDKQQVLSDLSVKLADRSSLVDLLVSLRGSNITLNLVDNRTASGRLIGVETSIDGEPTVILREIGSDIQDVAVYSVTRIVGLKLMDDRANKDVNFFLDVSQVEQTRTTLTVRVSEGEHDIGLSYLAPSPTWRMSYRLTRTSEGQARLVAWGVFENSLEEDLEDVAVTLVSGRPISFVYDLYESQVPSRPQVSDDTAILEQVSKDPRIVEAMRVISHDLRSPLSNIQGYADLLLYEYEGNLTSEQREFAQGIQRSSSRMVNMINDLLSMVEVRDTGHGDRGQLASAYRTGPLGDLKASGRYFTPITMSNAETEYMTYSVDNTVTVRRGQSAMVPIIDTEVEIETLVVYNGDKMPNHPLRVWSLMNTIGYALEQGPITIIDGGYAGEGLMRFAGVDDEIQVAYALEFGVIVTEEVQRSDHELYNLIVDTERRRINVQRSRITTIVYTLSSRVQRDVNVLIERRDPVRDQYYEMPDSIYEGGGHTRWAVNVPGTTTVTFPVHIRVIDNSFENVAELKSELVEDLSDAGLLTDPLLAQVRGVLQARRQLMVISLETKDLSAEITDIQAQQEQFRKNLAALGSSEREVTIREQVLSDLEASENRRREIQVRMNELDQETQQWVQTQETLLNDIFDDVSG